MPNGWIYILASDTGTLYTGVTSDLNQRVLQHRNGIRSGFAKKYGCKRLVHYEAFQDIAAAIAREKTIKGWSRSRKIALIESHNPQWKDFAEHLGKQMLMPNQNIAGENTKQAKRIQLSHPPKVQTSRIKRQQKAAR
ncbi:MAG: GIY-YIG nuclease family protein [Acidobacteria bacterium]|nr:GIY-YIG nuclease family protein [Acidobacteriota bacterium]